VSRITRLLNSTAEVWRATVTEDEGGGYAETWALASTVRCRFSQPPPTERRLADQADQPRTELSHTAYLEPDADVRHGDELRRAGRTYDVRAVYEPSEPGTYLRADCYARQPDNGGP
jgi:hypothetical protein